MFPGETPMKAAFIACVLALLPIIAAADNVASEDEEAALRARAASVSGLR